MKNPVHEQIFANFDPLVAARGINLVQGEELGATSTVIVHGSAGFAVRSLSARILANPQNAGWRITEYVTRLAPGIGVADLEQIRGASLSACKTISDIVPGIAADRALPSDLQHLEDDFDVRLCNLLEAMDTRGMEFDPPVLSKYPSGNLMIGPHLGIIDCGAADFSQTLPEKFRHVAQALLVLGRRSKTPIVDLDDQVQNHVVPVVVKLANTCGQRYGSSSAITRAVASRLRAWDTASV